MTAKPRRPSIHVPEVVPGQLQRIREFAASRNRASSHVLLAAFEAYCGRGTFEQNLADLHTAATHREHLPRIAAEGGHAKAAARRSETNADESVNASK